MSDTVKYLITDDKGEFVIELPRSWKGVTFSSVNPAAQGGGGFRGEGYCVRVWEKKDVLRAVFCNCKAIRDLSIPLARKVERQTGASTWASDSMGNFSENTEVKVEREFLLEAGGAEDIF